MWHGGDIASFLEKVDQGGGHQDDEGHHVAQHGHRLRTLRTGVDEQAGDLEVAQELQEAEEREEEHQHDLGHFMPPGGVWNEDEADAGTKG